MTTTRKQKRKFLALQACTGLAADTWEALTYLCSHSDPIRTLSARTWADLRLLDWAYIDEDGNVTATDGGHVALMLGRKALAAEVALAAVKEAAQ